MSSVPPSQLLAAIEALASDPPEELLADADLRSKVQRACRRASSALEQPTDLVVRLLLSQPVESAIVHIASDLELFAKLRENDGAPKSLESLVASTNCNPTLLKRILRALAAFGAVKEAGQDAYTLSPQYAILANADFGHAVANCADFLNPTYHALPSFLQSTNYENPVDPNNTAVQQAFGYKDTDLINILTEKPANAQGFGMLMSTWGEGHALLQHLYPVAEKLVKTYNEKVSPVMFVDVGGGYGQKAIALKEAFLDLPGRVIVQDLPMTIERAPKVEGITFMAHDFFTEQPVKDAKAYYIRQCLHNWPDDIAPEAGASAWVSVQDINMMALCGASERTEAAWRHIIEQAGLIVRSVYNPKDGVSEGLLEAAREAEV